MDGGEEVVEDEAVVESLREKAKAVHRRALLVAAGITVVVLFFPESLS